MRHQVASKAQALPLEELDTPELELHGTDLFCRILVKSQRQMCIWSWESSILITASWETRKRQSNTLERDREEEGGKSKVTRMDRGRWTAPEMNGLYLGKNSSMQAVICPPKHCFLLLIYKLYVAFF